MPPAYDDVVYFLDAARRLSVLERDGVLAAVAGLVEHESERTDGDGRRMYLFSFSRHDRADDAEEERAPISPGT